MIHAFRRFFICHTFQLTQSVRPLQTQVTLFESNPCTFTPFSVSLSISVWRTWYQSLHSQKRAPLSSVFFQALFELLWTIVSILFYDFCGLTLYLAFKYIQVIQSRVSIFLSTLISPIGMLICTLEAVFACDHRLLGLVTCSNVFHLHSRSCFYYSYPYHVTIIKPNFVSFYTSKDWPRRAISALNASDSLDTLRILSLILKMLFVI